jgi:hypothetical protein
VQVAGRTIAQGAGKDGRDGCDQPLVIEEPTSEGALEEVVGNRVRRVSVGVEVSIDRQLPTIELILLLARGDLPDEQHWMA